jgi:hypothetical protein
VQDEWAVCRVLNKDLAAKAGQMAQAAAAMEPTMDDFEGFFGPDDLPPLIDPFVVDDLLDFKGGAGDSSSGGSAAAAGTGGGGGGGYQVKAEQQTNQKPPAPQEPTNYFSLPAAATNTNTNTNAGGYPQQQAIRERCPEQQAPSTSRGETETGFAAGVSYSRPYPELLDDLLLDGGYLDYTNMWKI